MSEPEAAKQPNEHITISATDLARLAGRQALAAAGAQPGSDRDIVARILRHLVRMGWLRSTVSLAPIDSDMSEHPTVSHPETD